MTRQILIILTLISILGLTACRKGATFLNKEKGVVVNNGIDDCGLLIHTDDGKYFEAINIKSDLYKVGDRVKFTYKRTDYGGFCMSGEIIEIKNISKY